MPWAQEQVETLSQMVHSLFVLYATHWAFDEDHRSAESAAVYYPRVIEIQGRSIKIDHFVYSCLANMAARKMWCEKKYYWATLYKQMCSFNKMSVTNGPGAAHTELYTSHKSVTNPRV